jgi:hypothetical protein
MRLLNDSDKKALSKLRASAEKALIELRTLAEDLDRKLASKVRGGANQARAKRREVPEKDLLELGEKKAGESIVFGSEGETQLIFSPSKGKVEGAARWTVSLKGNTSRHDLQRELSKANRWLWDKEKDEPSVAFEAAEQLLACHVEELQALRVEVRPLQLNERPKIEAVMEQLSKMGERLETVSEQLMGAQAAIRLVVEALSERLGGKKLKIAFDLLQGDQWPQDIQKLWHCAMRLAGKLQRPPTKAELRKRYYPDRRIDPSQFTKLLKHAGLSWLPGAKSPRNLS